MKYVAFLRGINVGGNTLIKMSELQKVFASLGFRRVRTVMASGNVIFEASEENTADLAGTIMLKLRETYGRDIFAIVRPLSDLQELEARQPFKRADVTPGARLFVTFTTKNGSSPCPLKRDGFQILSFRNGIICSVLDEQPGVGAVHLMSAIEKEFGQDVTTRTWNTILRIIKAGNLL